MEKLIDFLMGLAGPVPYLIVFAILIACGLGIPIPEDVTLFTAGLAAYYGKANPHIMVFVSMVGVMMGDSIVFLLGRKYGHKITKRWPFKKILTSGREKFVKEKMHKHGNKFIFVARFMPGFRAPIFFTSGTMHLPFRVFFFYDGMAALISVPLIVYSLYYFGGQVDQVIQIIRNAQHGILILIFSVILFLFVKWYWKKRVEAE